MRSLSMPMTPMLGARQRVRTAPRRAIVAPGPVRRREIGLVELVFRRIAGLHGKHAVLRQQQHHAHLQHQRGLVRARPQHIVKRRGARELAAEGIELLGGPDPADRGVGLRAHPRRDVGHQDCDHHKKDEGRDIGRIGDGEGVDRRQKKEVVAERRGDGGQQRRPQAIADGDHHHRGQQHQIDIFDAKPWLDQFGRAETDGHDRERHQIGTRIERIGARRGLHRVVEGRP